MALIMEDMGVQIWVSALPYAPTGAAPTFVTNSQIIGVSRSVEYSDEFDSVNAGGAAGIKRRYFNRQQMVRLRMVTTYNADNVSNLSAIRGLTVYSPVGYVGYVRIKNNGALATYQDFVGVIRSFRMSTDQGNPLIEDIELDGMADTTGWSSAITPP